MRLDSIAEDGILFTRCYASSFRTDRALPCHTQRISRTAHHIDYEVCREDRPSSVAPALLDAEGYALSYYYGGDINFTSMNAYLMSAGFDRIICDRDFPWRSA